MNPALAALALLVQAPAPPAPPPAAAPEAGQSVLPQASGGWQTQAAVRRPGAGLLNPDVSVILDADFGRYGIHAADFEAQGLPLAGDDPGRSGFTMQEVELAFQEAIDPYLEGALFLTVPNLEGIEVEEGYLVTTSLPLNLQIKAGSFRSKLSRNGSQHLHLQNFTRRPLVTPFFFGADGLRGPGAQLSWLLPLPWFATLYGEAFSIGAPEDPSYATSFGGGANRGDPEDFAYTAVLEQFFDLTEAQSLLLGLGGATGQAFICVPAAAPGAACVPAPRRSFLYGGSLYYKWRPPNVVRSYASLQWTTEWWTRTLADGGPSEGGLYTEPVLQVARRIYLGGRFDALGVPSGPYVPRRWAASGSFTFAPSEFSRLRASVQQIWGPDAPQATVAFLQAEVSMGAHGAHPF